MSSLVAVIIPTRNRPGDLLQCLRSLQRQTKLPALVVVCDASDDEKTRAVCQTVSQEGNLVVRYRRSSSRGIAAQRNLALELVPRESDYVLFADDDVVFDEDYLSVLVGFLAGDDRHTIAGVAGVGRMDVNSPPLWLRAFVRVFLLGNTRARGKVLASGVNIAPPGKGESIDADWLFGCAMYRRSVFDDILFADELEGYGLYEDVDFSMRARAIGRLVVCPTARLIHNKSQIGRLDASSMAAMEITNRYWLIRRHSPRWRNRLAYWWSVAGLVIMQGTRSLAHRPGGSEKLRGILLGVRAVLQFRGARPWLD